MVPEIWGITDIIFLSFWTIFCPFTLLTAWKMNISKKWKKCLEISSFDTNVPKIMIIYYTVPEIWCVMDGIVIFHFGLFFVLLPTLTIQKIKISKKWKKKQNNWRYHHFTHVYQKLWLHDVWFLRYGVQRMDRQTEKVTYRGGCPTEKQSVCSCNDF